MNSINDAQITHPVTGDVVDGNGTYESGDGPDAVGHAHEDGRVAGSDVQVVHVESCAKTHAVSPLALNTPALHALNTPALHALNTATTSDRDDSSGEREVE